MSEQRDDMRELLSAYIDGEVTDEQSEAVERAVARDPELALELHELRGARRLLAGLPMERAPRGFVRRVMVRAERKHLLGDQQAGGAFRAARWITLAVAATVLMAAGVGIVAINMLETRQNESPVGPVVMDDKFGIVDGPEDPDVGGGLLHYDRTGGGNEVIGKDADGVLATGGPGAGGEPVVADTAFAYALANAKNTDIYTHEVGNTVAVLHETFDRNDLLPMELEAPVRATKAPAKAPAKKLDVSRGVYIDNGRNDRRVQIIVIASDEVIEKLNGDLDTLASVQVVSQAAAPDMYKSEIAGGTVAGEDRRGRTQLGMNPRGDETAGGVTAGDSKVGKGKGDGVRAENKLGEKGSTASPGGENEDRPGQVVPPVARPAEKPALPIVEPKPAPAGQSVTVTGPTTRPADAVREIREIQKGLLEAEGDGELAALSSGIAAGQKRLEPDEQIKERYSKLNHAIRRRIVIDDVRRNVQYEQERGVDVKALVININRRGLRNSPTATTWGELFRRYGRALSRPATTQTSQPTEQHPIPTEQHPTANTELPTSN